MSIEARIDQIAIGVRDLERATAFYRDILGLPFLFSAPNVAFFDCAGTRLMLGQSETGPPAQGTVVYFRSSALLDDFARISAAGAAVEREPAAVAPLEGGMLWIGFLRDTEGNLFGLTEVR